MRRQVETVLESIEKSLKLHKGGVEIAALDEAEGRLTLRFTGTCAHCSLSSTTFTEGVERALYLGVPDLRQVILVP